MINDEYADVTFALFALKARGEPQRLLVREAETLRQRLLHVPGVKKVNIIGEQAERIYVEFSPGAPGHPGRQGAGTCLRRCTARMRSRQPVRSRRGGRRCSSVSTARSTRCKRSATRRWWRRAAPWPLSDIATVRRGHEDPASFMVRNGGEPALLLGVVMRDGWNGLDLGKALEREVTGHRH